MLFFFVFFFPIFFLSQNGKPFSLCLFSHSISLSPSSWHLFLYCHLRAVSLPQVPRQSCARASDSFCRWMLAVRYKTASNSVLVVFWCCFSPYCLAYLFYCLLGHPNSRKGKWLAILSSHLRSGSTALELKLKHEGAIYHIPTEPRFFRSGLDTGLVKCFPAGWVYIVGLIATGCHNYRQQDTHVATGFLTALLV